MMKILRLEVSQGLDAEGKQEFMVTDIADIGNGWIG